MTKRFVSLSTFVGVTRRVAGLHGIPCAGQRAGDHNWVPLAPVPQLREPAMLRWRPLLHCVVQPSSGSANVLSASNAVLRGVCNGNTPDS